MPGCDLATKHEGIPTSAEALVRKVDRYSLRADTTKLNTYSIKGADTVDLTTVAQSQRQLAVSAHKVITFTTVPLPRTTPDWKARSMVEAATLRIHGAVLTTV